MGQKESKDVENLDRDLSTTVILVNKATDTENEFVLDMNRTENETSDSESDDDEVNDIDELHKKLEHWKKGAKQRSMRVLVCGQGGTGKSALINNFLQLEEDKLETGKKGKPVTTKVNQRKSETNSGIQVHLFDTPGFGDTDLSDKEIIDMMKSETKSLKLDIAFYCIALDGPARVQKADKQAIRLLTKTFTHKIWKRSVIVLTKANVLKQDVNSNYEEVIDNVKQSIKKVLKDEAGIDDQFINDVPIVTAGHTDPILKYETENYKNWMDQLFLAALKQVNPLMFPALFESRLSWKTMMSMVGTVKDGALVGTGVGAGAGAVFGEVTGPAGAAVGAAVGLVAGGAIGGTGAGQNFSGTFPVEIKPIVMIKFRKWKKKYKVLSKND